MTLGVGQFCVKPGLVLAPAGAAGDRLLKSLTDAVSDTDAGVLLDHRMRDNFVAGVAERAELPDVEAPVTPGRGRRAHRQRRLPDGRRPSSWPPRGPTTCSWRSASARSPSSPATTDEAEAERRARPAARQPHRHPPPLGARRPRARAAARSCSPSSRRSRARAGRTAGRPVSPSPPPSTTAAPTRPPPPRPPRSAAPRSSAGCGRSPTRTTPEALLPPELRDDNPLGLPRRFNGRWSGSARLGCG